MSPRRVNRRDFVALAGSTGITAAVPAARAANGAKAPRAGSVAAIPDGGWRLWIDEKAAWRDDTIYLPGDADLSSLPVNPPSGGWDMLAPGAGLAVTLPATVEQFCWGKFGEQPYTIREYAWAPTDPVPQDGAYRGVSWWWREIEIPSAWRGRRIVLSVRGARLRAEVYLNRKLVGYSIMEELPFECDLTEAAEPGGVNRLAIRITNPGGRYDWIDGDTIAWGKVNLPTSHGFGGLDRGMTLSTHPLGGRIADLWVLNTPDTTTVAAFVKLDPEPPNRPALRLEVIDEASGCPLAAVVQADGRDPGGVLRLSIRAPKAKLWTLDTPHLYRLRVRWRRDDGQEDRREVTFGFRWFAPAGLGTNAVFRLNGRRIKLYAAISWGYWGLNGVWPTAELAQKEVAQAKVLGLNCLCFHRNVGKEDVLRAQDRLGLLRIMEPGGGKFALGKLPANTKIDAHSVVMERPTSEADLFAQRFMVAKCVAMVRAFRSHPSLVQYTLQNEAGADLNNPDTLAALDAMRAEDPSRVILLNDGMIAPPTLAAQAWYAPYESTPHRSDKEPWGGWWDDHQGAGDQWYDAFYKNPESFNYRQPIAPQIVAFGEMEGCAVPDNHVLAIAQILQYGGYSYDLADHRAILDGYQKFLDRWGFRAAFPTAESLFHSIGAKCYGSWQQYMENARINDATDLAVISGWETTAIDNHSGIVDNLRNFKGDPAVIRASLMPVRPVAKQRSLTVALGGRAVFDLYLLNDTGRPAAGTLSFTMTDPGGRRVRLGTFPAPRLRPEQFSALVKEGLATPPLEREGLYRFAFSLASAPHATHVRDVFVTDTGLPPVVGRTLRVGVAGIWPILRQQLAAIPGLTVEDFVPGASYSAIIGSGLTDRSTPAQRLGGDAGLTLQRADGSKPVPGELPAQALAAVKAGTPLLVMAQEDGLADGVARQLAAAGAFTYESQIGRLRAPWMGNWYFLREHPVYGGLPPNQAMGQHFQTHGRQANGLVVDGPDVDVFVGYGRDHDRRVGAGTFTAKLGRGKVLFQRVPDFAAPVQQRFLRNALSWLCG
ncbi:MAG: sugar-binding domain-containing protein [Rhizomicrobium sp.]